VSIIWRQSGQVVYQPLTPLKPTRTENSEHCRRFCGYTFFSLVFRSAWSTENSSLILLPWSWKIWHLWRRGICMSCPGNFVQSFLAILSFIESVRERFALKYFLPYRPSFAHINQGSIVGSGTVLQSLRSRVAFPMRSLDFSNDLTLWPWDRLSF
jgi:hypothetical protein